MLAKATLGHYLELCKPKVVALMLLTAWVGMLLAADGSTSPWTLLLATGGIACVAGAAAVLNHLLDRHLDVLMQRTQRRPMVTGDVQPKQALQFAFGLLSLGSAMLLWGVNGFTAVLSWLTLIGYAVVYTLYLKHATPQNIVIGGLAGAFPPLLGWTAVTGQISAQSCLLVLIIFVWTPPHFWALAIHRHQDYARAHIPMLPVTHGIAFTKLNIVLYTVLLLAVSMLPFAIGMSGLLYLGAALLLGLGFCYHAVRLYRYDDPTYAMKTFRFSIHYLMWLFGLMLIDHYQ